MPLSLKQRLNMKPPYNILYVSMLMSPALYAEATQNKNIRFNAAAQKFHALLAAGIRSNELCGKLDCLSGLLPWREKIFQSRKTEEQGGISYSYVSYWNLPVLSLIFRTWHIFFGILRWSRKHSDSKIILLDPLVLYLFFPTVLAAGLLRIKVVLVVTDLLECMGETRRPSLMKRFVSRGFVTLGNCCDGYVFLTAQMSDVLNRRKTPWLLLEGLIPAADAQGEKPVVPDENKKIVLYAGGLYKIYGVELLLEAFRFVKVANAELHLYGLGELEKTIASLYMAQDPRIRYFGVLPTEQVFQAEQRATLLINPRIIPYEFTKYSFPSKNLEYMSSGTPMAGAMLPGIPEEYADHMFLLTRTEPEGLSEELTGILLQPAASLREKGKKARIFAETRKNNLYQADRLLHYLESIS